MKDIVVYNRTYTRSQQARCKVHKPMEWSGVEWSGVEDERRGGTYPYSLAHCSTACDCVALWEMRRLACRAYAVLACHACAGLCVVRVVINTVNGLKNWLP